MSDTNSAVFGIHSTHAALETAVDALRAKEFRSSDISVLSVQNPAFMDVTHDKDETTPGASAGPSPAAAVGGPWDGWWA
jgi:hypothetical protein